MAAFLSAVIVLVPLLITPGILFYFDVTPKVMIVLLGAAAALPWLALKGLPVKRELRWLYLLLLAQTLCLALSAAFSSRPELSVFGSTWRKFGLITQDALFLFTAAVAIWVSGNTARQRVLLRAVAAAGIPIALYGILQYFGWDPWLPAHSYHVGEGIWTIVRPPATLGHADYFATYLLFVVFAGTGLYTLEQNLAWRCVGSTAAVFGIAGIMLSGTRAALLGLILGGLFLLAWIRPRWRTQTAVIAASLLVLGGVFYLSPAGQQLRSRVHWAQEDLRGGARLWLWRDSLDMAIHHPLLGTGPETFPSVFPRYESKTLAKAYPDFYHESPHNIFLDALTSQGLPGFLILAGLVTLGFYAAWQARQTELKLSAILASALAASLVSQEFTVFTLPTALYFYLMVAMMVGVAPALPETCGRRNSSHWLAALPISVLLVFLSVRLVVGDRYLELARKDLQTDQFNFAIEDYATAGRWGSRADLWYSRSMMLASRKAPDMGERLKIWQQAMQAGIKSTRTADDPQNAYYNLASLYAAQNDVAKTEESLRQAIASAPNWFKPHWTLAQVLAATGRLKEASAEASTAAELNDGKNPEVNRTRELIHKRLQQDR